MSVINMFVVSLLSGQRYVCTEVETVKDAREIGSSGGYADSASTIAAPANKTAARYLESATIPIVIATCQISERLFVDRDHTMQ